MNPVVNGCQTMPFMCRHGTEPGMRMAHSATEYTEASDGRLIAGHLFEKPVDHIGIALKARLQILHANLLSKQTIVGQSFKDLRDPFIDDTQMIEHHEHRPVAGAVLKAHYSIVQHGAAA